LVVSEGVGIGGSGLAGGGVVEDGMAVVSVGVAVPVKSVAWRARAARVRRDRGQSSGVSGYSMGLSAMYSMGLSAMYSSGRLLPKAFGSSLDKSLKCTSESEMRPSLSSGSVSLYHMVPYSSMTMPRFITRGICPGIPSVGGVSGEPPGEVMYAGSSPAI
jgi:hypothetical protein